MYRTLDKYCPNYGLRPKEQQRNGQLLDLPLISCFKEEVWAGVVCFVVTKILGVTVVLVVFAFAVAPVTIVAVAFVLVVVDVLVDDVFVDDVLVDDVFVDDVFVDDVLVDVGSNAAVLVLGNAAPPVALDVHVVVSTEGLAFAVEDDVDFGVVAGDVADVDDAVIEFDDDDDAAEDDDGNDDDGVEDAGCVVVVVVVVVNAVVFDDDDDNEAVPGDEDLPVNEEDEYGNDDDDDCDNNDDCDSEKEYKETDAFPEEAGNDDVDKFDDDDIIEYNDEEFVSDSVCSTQRRRRIVINTKPYDISVICVESKKNKNSGLKKERLLHFVLSIYMFAVSLK